MRILLAVLLMTGSCVQAREICDDLWLSRNMIFAQKGYCFSSPLAQSVFSGFQCTGTDVTLTDAEQDRLNDLRAREAEIGCVGVVDTKRTTLDVLDLNLRLLIQDQPVREPFESRCIGFNRPVTLPLHVAASSSSQQIGAINPGDTIDFQYTNIGPWRFVRVLREGQPSQIGWVADLRMPNDCASAAG